MYTDICTVHLATHLHAMVANHRRSNERAREKDPKRGERGGGEWRNGSVVHATAPLQHCPFALIVAIQRQFVTGLEKEGAVAKAGTLVTQGRIKVISCPLRYG